MYTWYRGFQLKSNPNTLEPERLLHVCPSACVIAQQFSSATFRLFAHPFPQGKIHCAFQKEFSFYFLFFYVFLNRVRLELPGRELYTACFFLSLHCSAELSPAI